MEFSDPCISIATPADIPAIKTLLDKAYRGEESKKGWTTEAHLIAGDVRTSEETVQETMHTPGSVFLKYVHSQIGIIGCVNLQKQGDKLYLGMFSVSPVHQGAGLGKKILTASEEYAKHAGCLSIYMSVISVRTDLINWYLRYGYADTGERKPFEEDGIHGKHLQHLEFMVLEKYLTP